MSHSSAAVQLQPGLYEHLLRLVDQQQLQHLNPQLYTLAQVDPEEGHHAVAQHVEPPATTMYADDAISEDRFHWQSQRTTAVNSATGQRYLHHREQRYTPLLFVREYRQLPNGLTSPFPGQVLPEE